MKVCNKVGIKLEDKVDRNENNGVVKVFTFPTGEKLYYKDGDKYYDRECKHCRKEIKRHEHF